MATVLISGASKGIGRATALHLDAKGFTVIAGVRKKEDAESLRSAASGRLKSVILDITNRDQILEAARMVKDIVGAAGLDGLVNNAGIAVPAPLEFIPIDEFRRQIEVNLIGQLALTQALVELLRTAKGRIINISSVGGRISGPMLGAYHASKFAIEALTDTLRQELAPWHIRVASIEPGAVATPIWEAGAKTADLLMGRMPDRARELYGQAISRTRAGAESAARRGIPPEQVARVVEEALTARRPRTRYPVGRDGKLGARLLARLPDPLAGPAARFPSAVAGGLLDFQDVLHQLEDSRLGKRSNGEPGLVIHRDEKQAWDALDPKHGSHVRLFVDIDFVDVQLAVILLGNLLEDRGDHLAGPAPFRPEIDDGGDGPLELPFRVLLVVEYLRDECVFRQVLGHIGSPVQSQRTSLCVPGVYEKTYTQICLYIRKESNPEIRHGRPLGWRRRLTPAA